jgi:putative ABC transport system permease protein
MSDPPTFDGVKRALEDDPRFRVDAHREYDFYADQSSQLTQILNFAALFIAGIMAIGAIFGAVNTMDGSLAARAPEIAVLRTLGFTPRSILASFLLETELVALLGGLVGCLLTLPINGIVTSTTNWASFSEVAFAFRVTPDLWARGILFALVMGLVGGLVPARHAARLPVVEALRRA